MQLVLLLVVIAVALLLLLAAILSMRSCHLFVSTCWADPDLNLRLLYRQLCCLNPGALYAKFCFLLLCESLFRDSIWMNLETHLKHCPPSPSPPSPASPKRCSW